MGAVFWIIEGILYALFLTGDWCDFFGASWIRGWGWYRYSSICKYAALLLCLVYACGLRSRKGRTSSRSKQEKALLGVLGFAAAADYFLLFTDSFMMGILFFCMVQCCYCLYFAGEKEKCALWRSVGIGFGVTAGVWCLVQAGTFGGAEGWKKADLWLLLVAALYGSLLIQNLIRAWNPFRGNPVLKIRRDRSLTQKKKSRPVGVWGQMAILLLFLCDIHVALYNIEEIIPDGMELSWLQIWCEAAGVLMWLFYLPSQLCIVKCIKGQSTYK